MSLKISTLLFLCCFQSLTLLAQNTTRITGYIYDEETKLPLPYVNIGFINESVGTVTDDNGKFDLTFDLNEISNNSILQISYVGYSTIRLQASSFYVAVVKNNKFYLKPAPFDLDEVILTNDLRKENEFGSLRINHNRVGYWLNPEALGGEIATKFSIDKEKTKLHDLKFYVIKNNSGGIKVRVNIYGYKNGVPSENLLSENIYHTIEVKSGIETINLEPYYIVVYDDIVVSLELIKVNGRYIDFEIGVSDYKSHSFIRLSHQDEWKRFTEVGMAIKVRTSYPSDKGKIIAKIRKPPNNITIYWDASLSMKDPKRNVEKELELLEKYLKELKNVNVKIIKFSALIFDEHKFYLESGNSDGVISNLRNTDYEGEASFSDILKTNDFKANTVLLFSSAETILEPLEQAVYLPTFSINSNPNANHSKLQTASFYGDGYYINLNKVSVKEGLEMMLTENNDNASYEETQTTEGIVKGRVISDSLIIPRASIKVKNTYIETESDNEGYFNIDAVQGDILVVNALGMLEKEFTVSKKPEVEINLIPNTTLLDEVTLYGKPKQKTNTVLTPYGVKNVDAIGYTANELTKDDISPGDITYDDVIGKLPGVMISGVGMSKRYSFLINVMSSTGMYVDTNPIIVIDDIVYFQKDGLDHLPPIDIKSIESVRAIKSVVGTNRYGSAGAYGAIEIRTYDTSLDKREEVKKKENSALAKGNDYVDDGIPVFDDFEELPQYVQALDKATNFEEAKTLYINQKAKVPLTISYIIGVSEYFKKWNQDYAHIVLTGIAAIAGENAKALKTLAYKLEEAQHFDTAKLVYERIAEMRPDDAQSYRDLANIYQETGDYDKAMELYKQMLGNNINGVDFSVLQQPIIDELKHLLAFHRGQVDYKDLPSELLSPKLKQDLRIVFEWNDPNAGFELQFVNPQKKFYKWAHTKFDNLDRIQDEIKNGYTTEVFIIDEDVAGEWIINIEALNEEASINPNYLKYTVYKNYGLSNETKTVQVIQLKDLVEKVTLDKFMYLSK